MPDPALARAIETVRWYIEGRLYDSMNRQRAGDAFALIERALAEREGEREQMQHALELPLLFHGGGPWDDRRRLRWRQITESDEATTKKMCDHIRRVLGLPARPRE